MNNFTRFNKTLNSAFVDNSVAPYDIKRFKPLPEEDVIYSIAGVSNPDPSFKPMPIVIGRIKVIPNLAIRPFTLFRNNKQYIVTAYHFGVDKDLEITNVQINNTDPTNSVFILIPKTGGILSPGFTNVDTLKGAEIFRPRDDSITHKIKYYAHPSNVINEFILKDELSFNYITENDKKWYLYVVNSQWFINTYTSKFQDSPIKVSFQWNSLLSEIAEVLRLHQKAVASFNVVIRYAKANFFARGLASIFKSYKYNTTKMKADIERTTSQLDNAFHQVVQKVQETEIPGLDFEQYVNNIQDLNNALDPILNQNYYWYLDKEKLTQGRDIELRFYYSYSLYLNNLISRYRDYSSSINNYSSNYGEIINPTPIKGANNNFDFYLINSNNLSTVPTEKAAYYFGIYGSYINLIENLQKQVFKKVQYMQSIGIATPQSIQDFNAYKSIPKSKADLLGDTFGQLTKLVNSLNSTSRIPTRVEFLALENFNETIESIIKTIGEIHKFDREGTSEVLTEADTRTNGITLRSGGGLSNWVNWLNEDNHTTGAIWTYYKQAKAVEIDAEITLSKNSVLVFEAAVCSINEDGTTDKVLQRIRIREINNTDTVLRKTYTIWEGSVKGVRIGIRKLTGDDSDNKLKINNIKIYQDDEADYSWQRRIGIVAEASQNTSGTLGQVTAIAERKIPVFKSGKWMENYTSNPAWWLLWWLIGKRTGDDKRLYGGGLSKEAINMQEIKNFAQWCDLKQLTVNMVIEGSETVQDVANKIAACGRGKIRTIRGMIGIYWDDDKLTPSYLFCNANIIHKSLSIKWASGYLADEFTLSFPDESQNWALSSVVSKILDTDLRRISKTNLYLPGCTNLKMAKQHVSLAAAAQIYLRAEFEFETDLEGLLVLPGDIIYLNCAGLGSGYYSGNVVEIDRLEGSYLTFNTDIDKSFQGATIKIKTPQGIKSADIKEIIGQNIILSKTLNLGKYDLTTLSWRTKQRNKLRGGLISHVKSSVVDGFIIGAGGISSLRSGFTVMIYPKDQRQRAIPAKIAKIEDIGNNENLITFENWLPDPKASYTKIDAAVGLLSFSAPILAYKIDFLPNTLVGKILTIRKTTTGQEHETIIKKITGNIIEVESVPRVQRELVQDYQYFAENNLHMGTITSITKPGSLTYKPINISLNKSASQPNFVSIEMPINIRILSIRLSTIAEQKEINFRPSRWFQAYTIVLSGQAQEFDKLYNTLTRKSYYVFRLSGQAKMITTLSSSDFDDFKTHIKDHKLYRTINAGSFSRSRLLANGNYLLVVDPRSYLSPGADQLDLSGSASDIYVNVNYKSQGSSKFWMDFVSGVNQYQAIYKMGTRALNVQDFVSISIQGSSALYRASILSNTNGILTTSTLLDYRRREITVHDDHLAVIENILYVTEIQSAKITTLTPKQELDNKIIQINYTTGPWVAVVNFTRDDRLSYNIPLPSAIPDGTAIQKKSGILSSNILRLDDLEGEEITVVTHPKFSPTKGINLTNQDGETTKYKVEEVEGNVIRLKENIKEGDIITSFKMPNSMAGDITSVIHSSKKITIDSEINENMKDLPITISAGDVITTGRVLNNSKNQILAAINLSSDEGIPARWCMYKPKENEQNVSSGKILKITTVDYSSSETTRITAQEYDKNYYQAENTKIITRLGYNKTRLQITDDLAERIENLQFKESKRFLKTGIRIAVAVITWDSLRNYSYFIEYGLRNEPPKKQEATAGKFVFDAVKGLYSVKISGRWKNTLAESTLNFAIKDEPIPGSQPTGVNHNFVTNGIAFSWDDCTDEDYVSTIVKIGKHGDNWDTSTLVVNTKASNYLYKWLKTGMYKLLVKHVNQDGPSPIPTKHTFAVNPPQKIIFTDVETQKNTVILRWDPAQTDQSIGGYEIRYSLAGLGVKDSHLWATVGSDTLTGLIVLRETGKVTLFVRAFDIAGNFGEYHSVDVFLKLPTNLTIMGFYDLLETPTVQNYYCIDKKPFLPIRCAQSWDEKIKNYRTWEMMKNRNNSFYYQPVERSLNIPIEVNLNNKVDLALVSLKLNYTNLTPGASVSWTVSKWDAQGRRFIPSLKDNKSGMIQNFERLKVDLAVKSDGIGLVRLELLQLEISSEQQQETATVQLKASDDNGTEYIPRGSFVDIVSVTATAISENNPKAMIIVARIDDKTTPSRIFLYAYNRYNKRQDTEASVTITGI